MISSDKLAIEGGSPSFDPGEIKPWPPVDDADRQAVLAVFGRGKYTFDYESRSFQEEFAAWNGNQHAIFTNSGTAALHMCVAACGVGAGDHVLVPAYSWSSSATCVIHHNGIPVFVDIDWDTMNIDVDKIEAAITPRTKAIIVVHLHGPEGDRRCLSGARSVIPRTQDRDPGRLCGVLVQPEQVPLRGGGRDVRHQR